MGVICGFGDSRETGIERERGTERERERERKGEREREKNLSLYNTGPGGDWW